MIHSARARGTVVLTQLGLLAKQWQRLDKNGTYSFGGERGNEQAKLWQGCKALGVAADGGRERTEKRGFEFNRRGKKRRRGLNVRCGARWRRRKRGNEDVGREFRQISQGCISASAAFCIHVM